MSVSTIAAAMIPGVGKTEGKRLEAYVRARWGREQGGIVALASASGVSPDALYKWFRGVHPPTLEGLGGLAKALGVKRHELVAVLDGERAGTDVVTLLGPEAREELVEWLAEEMRRRMEE